ncbi:MAG: YciI family protein [Solirubrobacteraceae bacterium]
MSDNEAYHLLLYTYVEDMVDRRGPYREAHLQRIQSEKHAGRIVMAGALGTPPTGGAMVWRGASEQDIRQFAEADPYAGAGLITEVRVEPWNLV